MPLVAAAAMLVAVLVPAPVGAEVTGVTPSTAEVAAGGNLTVAVTVLGRGCVAATPPAQITVTIRRTCGGNQSTWTTDFAFAVASGVAAAPYTVVAAANQQGAPLPDKPLFTLTVTAEPGAGSTTTTAPTPTTTSPTTPTTTAPPTTNPPTTTPGTTATSTTAGPTTPTSGSPSTSAPGGTTLPPAGSTSTPQLPGSGAAAPAPAVGGALATGNATPVAGSVPSGRPAAGGVPVAGAARPATAGPGPVLEVVEGAAGSPLDPAALPWPARPGFASLASLVGARPTFGQRLFLPLPDALRACLPLQAPCGDPAGALVLVPLGGVDVGWTAAGDGQDQPLPVVRTDDAAPLPALGVAPPDPEATTFLLPVLRAAGSGELLLTPRRFEPGRGLVTGPTGPGAAAGAVLPTAVGAALPPPSPAPKVALGQPVLVGDDDLRTRTPVVVVFGSGRMPVLFGIDPDPDWKLKQTFLPLFGSAAVPFLAERADGSLGLLLPQPADGAGPASVGATGLAGGGDLPSSRGNTTVVLALLGLVIGVVLLAAAGRRLPPWWRSRAAVSEPLMRWRRIP